MKARWMAALGLGLLLGIGGCKTAQEVELPPDYSRPLPPGELALRKITDPADIPSMTIACYELDKLREAIDNSLSYMSKPSSQKFYPYGEISHAQVVASLEAFGQLLDSGLTGKQLEAAIREKFDVYTSVGWDNKGTVLFTGYYTPIFDGSMTQSGRFQYPLYKQPADLVKGENGEILGRSGPGGQFTPYPSRAELEASGELKGKELIWLSDPFEVYIAHVQGSAKIRTANGKLVTVSYAANNGHEYASVGQALVKAGKIPADKLSLKSMMAYFKAHPNEVNQYVAANPRFVFFRADEGEPRGSLNEPVIALRTIATDKSIYPRASLAFLQSILPRTVGTETVTRPFQRFVLDQDTGGAIRAPGRCDVYMGQGDEAGELAGKTYQEGRLYYFFLKPGQTPGPAFDSKPIETLPGRIDLTDPTMNPTRTR
ncbi:MAG: murein transglycosylase [Phycisphaerae bacterium]|nr:murein transglycosylase [Phycisphaerae bacterium]